MGRNKRRRIAWVWSITYFLTSLCISGGAWIYLSFSYAQAVGASSLGALGEEAPRLAPSLFAPDALGGLEVLPGEVIGREVLALGGRALVLVMILGWPGFELNQQVWAALRARPRRVLGRRVYGWKLLAFNIAILLAAPLLASLQFALGHARWP